MVKRTIREIRKSILKALSDGKEHSYCDLERRVNTNWKTVRDHCDELKFFKAITISENKKIKITKYGLKLLKESSNLKSISTL